MSAFPFPRGWYPDWVQTKAGYECRNWPPPHEMAPYPGCVEWVDFMGHMNALAEAAYQRGQADAAAGVLLDKPWLHVGSDLGRLAFHIAESKEWFGRSGSGGGRG